MQLSIEQLKALSALADRWLVSSATEREALSTEVASAGTDFSNAFSAMIDQLDSANNATLVPAIPDSLREAAMSGTNPISFGRSDFERAMPQRQTNEHVGPYRLIRELGRGGMGVVWLAERADGQHTRQVALKMPLVENLNWLLAARFARERNILASLEHPGIARLYDAGVDEKTQPYIAIEYVQGQPITEYVREKKLKPEATAQLFIRVIEAVAHAHTQLVIHRDIKPSNILVDAKGEPHLLDFGIAKLLDDEDSPTADATQLTRLSGRALTLDYASPEQVNNASLGTASDVYSLGIVLYELLTGSRPYHPKGPTRRDLEQAILDQDPSKPSDQLLTANTGDSESGKSARRMRGDLDTVVLKALRKDPKQRYVTAQAFADDLKRYLAFEPIAAKPDSEWYRIGRFVRRNRVIASAAVVSIVALITGFSIALWQRDVAQQQAIRADAERSRAVSELTYSEVINDFVAFLLSTGSSQPYTTAELLNRAEKLAVDQYPDDATLRARLLVMVAHEFMRLGDFQRSEHLLDRAANAVANVAPTDESLASMIDCTKGLLYAFDTRQHQSRLLLDAAIERLGGAPSVDASVLSYCLNSRGRLHYELLDDVASRKDIDRAIMVLGTPRPGQHAQLINLQERLASAFAQAGRHEDAERAHMMALATLQKINREQSPQGANLWNGLGTARVLAGRWLAARDAFEKSLHISESVEAQANMFIANNYAGALAETGDYARAAPFFESALALAITKQQPASVAWIALRAGRAYCESRQLERCNAMIDIAREQLPHGYPADDYVFAGLDLLKGTAAELAGNRADALVYVRKANADFSERRAPLVLRIRCAAYLATLAAAQGNIGEARQAIALLASLKKQNTAETPSNAFLGEALLAEATVQIAEGKAQEARPLLLQAREYLLNGAGAAALSTKRAELLLQAK